ncbi:hypothetical protein CLOM_g24482 [Closterium sp. NIES-68]|nr:hypothetical protein CLOM_g24482 [Closterium sp. NIES-68]GJP85077.1 hypothetical protein CLOP_g15178 [Closterium sp. NIES-67]
MADVRRVEHSPDSVLLAQGLHPPLHGPHGSGFHQSRRDGVEIQNGRRILDTSKLPPRDPASSGRNVGRSDRRCSWRLSSTSRNASDFDLSGWMLLAQRLDDATAHSSTSPLPVSDVADPESASGVVTRQPASHCSDPFPAPGDLRRSRTEHLGSMSLRFSHSEAFAETRDMSMDDLLRRRSASNLHCSPCAFDSLTDFEEEQRLRCTRCFHTPSPSRSDATAAALCVGCSLLDAELACDPNWIDDARARIGGAALAVVEAQQAAEELSARVGMAAGGQDVRDCVEVAHNVAVRCGRQPGSIVRFVAAAKGWVTSKAIRTKNNVRISLESSSM